MLEFSRRDLAARDSVKEAGDTSVGQRMSCQRKPLMTLADQLRSKKKALTVEELADLLGVAIRTVYKEVEDDHIPFFRVRSSIRFDPHQVADWLEGKIAPHAGNAR